MKIGFGRTEDGRQTDRGQTDRGRTDRGQTDRGRTDRGRTEEGQTDVEVEIVTYLVASICIYVEIRDIIDKTDYDHGDSLSN